MYRQAVLSPPKTSHPWVGQALVPQPFLMRLISKSLPSEGLSSKFINLVLGPGLKLGYNAVNGIY